VETLAAVKDAGLATALVSNAGFTTAPALRSMLDAYGLTPYFDALVFSDDLLVAKPDARMFERAIEALGIGTSECVYVGDSPHSDVFGAQQAGIFAVQIGPRTRDGITPDLHIDRLEELMPALSAHWSIEPAERVLPRVETRRIDAPGQPVS
jgi:FMN phosphatase YigB (HAD superfamily)